LARARRVAPDLADRTTSLMLKFAGDPLLGGGGSAGDARVMSR
jgi:hypothetical protein